MELMRIHLQLQPAVGLDSPCAGIRQIPFGGVCEGPIFRGQVLPGGVDTQTFPTPERGYLSARYTLEGVDADGVPTKLYVDNSAVMQNGQDTVTYPRILTDNPALRWLESAALTGRLEGSENGLDIVIYSEDTPLVKHLALRRAGLTLRGRLERPHEKPCPLVLMLHGFGGDGGLSGGDAWYQHLSSCLTARGLATLRFDFNGHGQSEGEFSHMTVYNELEDASVFLRYAMALENVTEIYVLGHSQGGVVGGMLAGYYQDVVKKLALMAPAVSLKTDAQQGRCMMATYDPKNIPEKVNVDGTHQVGGLYFRFAQTLPIYEVTAQYHGPMLVSCVGRDGVVSQEAAQRYQEGNPQADVRIYPTLDHGLGGEEQPQAMETIFSFLAN